MSDIFVAYDQLIDAYVAVRHEEGIWREVHGLDEAVFDELPALTGKERYTALADVRGVDRDRACAHATRALKRRAKQVKQWDRELEEFLAVSAARHQVRERELANLKRESDELIQAIMKETAA